jgi:hypothetical protein
MRRGLTLRRISDLTRGRLERSVPCATTIRAQERCFAPDMPVPIHMETISIVLAINAQDDQLQYTEASAFAMGLHRGSQNTGR